LIISIEDYDSILEEYKKENIENFFQYNFNLLKLFNYTNKIIKIY